MKLNAYTKEREKKFRAKYDDEAGPSALGPTQSEGLDDTGAVLCCCCYWSCYAPWYCVCGNGGSCSGWWLCGVQSG